MISDIKLITGKPYYEYKYLVSLKNEHRVNAFLSQYLITPSDHNHSYIRSLYYDTHDLKAYHQGLAGDHTRQKLRFRTLSDASVANSLYRFELKNKKNQRTTKIQLINVPNNVCEQNDPLVSLRRSENVVLQTFLSRCDLFIQTVNPKVRITYSRRRYIAPINDMRINFDSEIVSHVVAEHGLASKLPYIKAPFSVLEIKSPKIPHVPWFLGFLNLKHTGLSKYCYFISRHLDDRNYRLQF